MSGPDDLGLTGADLAAAAQRASVHAALHDAGRAKQPTVVGTERADPWPLVGIGLDDLRVAPPRRKWLLMQSTGTAAEPLLPCGKVGILSAAGGTGKTAALVGLALAVATGRPWLQAGYGVQVEPGFGVASPGRVAILLAEEDREEIRRRLYYAARLMGLRDEDHAAVVERLWFGPLAGLPVELVDRTPEGNVTETQRARELRARLAELDGADGWALIIVDPLSRFGGVDLETDNGSATRAVQAIEALTRLPGEPAVMVAHHERKGSATDEYAGQEAVRGSSAIVDAGRWVTRLVPAMLGRDRWVSEAGLRGVILRLVKTNYTPPLPGCRLLMLDRDHRGAVRVATKAEMEDLRLARASLEKKEPASKSTRRPRPRGPA